MYSLIKIFQKNQLVFYGLQYVQGIVSRQGWCSQNKNDEGSIIKLPHKKLKFNGPVV